MGGGREREREGVGTLLLYLLVTMPAHQSGSSKYV